MPEEVPGSRSMDGTDPDEQGTTEAPARGYWLFHANPARFPVFEQLLDGQMEVQRCVTQHRADISTGDGAVLWLSGKAAGVYAIGEVVGEPADVVADEGAVQAVRPPTSVSCLLRWSDVRPHDPISKHELLASGRFAAARIIRQPMAGNPLRLTEGEWEAVQDLR